MSTTSIDLRLETFAAQQRGGPLGRGASLVAGLVLFVLALELVKQGAAGLAPVLQRLDISGVRGAFGSGWLMACGLLSGSPVAATALGMLAGGSLAPRECLSMIVGSRVGASFVVVVVGVVQGLRAGRDGAHGAYIGVTALILTAVTCLPAMLLGLRGFDAGWFTGFGMEARQIASVVARVAGPVGAAVERVLSPPFVFGLGVMALLVALRVFDGALPDVNDQRRRLLGARNLFERPGFAFAAGMAVTAATLSVSMSLSLMLPLAARGVVRRQSVWPYVLGANITTFDDTLFAAALVGHKDAVRVVALLVAAVSLVSLPLVFLAPRAVGAVLDRLASSATAGPRPLLAFLALVLLVPALMIVI